MTRADVCVVGAGPAGTSAARELVRDGARVVLVERRDRPGAKACGGALPRSAFEPARLDPGRLPPWARLFSTLEVRGPLGSRRLEQDWPVMMTIDRAAWLAGRIDELRDLGCDVRLGTRFRGWREGIASLDRGEIACGCLVGADGAASRVRRGLGLPAGLVVRAFQLTLPADDPAAARLARRGPAVWFDPFHFRAGYGWAFPAADEVRLGAGASSAILHKDALKRAFLSWLRRLGVDPARGRFEAGTIGCGYLGHRFGPVSLAGDAAGLASPVTGEGIRQALVSGGEVAREIGEPGTRSAAIAAMAADHHRTHDVLARPFLGPALFALAPFLLGLPWIERAAIRRFVVTG